MIALRPLLERHGIQQRELAEHLGLSRAALAQWLNHEHWPARRDSAELRAAVSAWLAERAIPATERTYWWRPIPQERAEALLRPGRGRGRRAGVRESSAVLAEDGTHPEDTIMLLRGHRLSPSACRAFGMARDPFHDEVREAADLYLTPDMRYCREAMRAVAEHGGMTAIVGESGSGKTTLRDDLHEWVERGGDKVILIEPYVIDMDERGGRRITLGAREIAAAILHTLAPHERVRQDSQARFAQVHQRLADSHRAGRRHCLLIEEAHDLPTSTLRHLKRYLELRTGHVPLLSVLLLGQPELGHRLSELDASIREIVQRCQVVRLEPLDGRLAEYLRHKFARVGADLDRVLDGEAIAAIRDRLTVDTGRGRGATTGTVSLLYPLAVQNLLTAALNKAADLGLERVGADVVAEV